MDLMLKGKCVVVTGGTRNIGAAIVIAFLNEGANVVTTFRQNSKAAERFMVEVPSHLKHHFHVYNLDVSSDQGCRELCNAATREFGGLDVVVNNAAVNLHQRPEEVTDEGFDIVLHNTLRSTIYMMRAAFSIMQQRRKGRIVNISSAGVYAANPNELVYLCAKAGVEASTRSYARLGAPHGITVNAIAPHLIMTGMGVETLSRDPTILTRIPLGRAGRIDELVNLVLYLSSELSEYMTGQILHLNGGRLMK